MRKFGVIVDAGAMPVLDKALPWGPYEEHHGMRKHKNKHRECRRQYYMMRGLLRVFFKLLKWDLNNRR